jgi:hypothetical protein
MRPLVVQLFHALIPLTGTAAVSARTASMVIALVALAAIYALGHRAAGRLGALAALGAAVAAAPLRDAAVAGDALPVLVLSGALFVYALHAALAQATRPAMVTLAAAAALVALADPAWLPGAVLVVVLVALLRAGTAGRRRAVGAGLLTLALLLAPHVASTADQNAGRPFADLSARAITARNAEFEPGTHGAPTAGQLTRDPLSGDRVSLASYILGDHSAGEVADGVASGANDAAGAYAARGGAGLLASLALALVAIGTLYLLVVPRLRLMVLLPPLITIPALFIADRGGEDAAAAAAVAWPAFLAAGAMGAYAVAQLLRPLAEPWVRTAKDLGIAFPSTARRLDS